MLIVGAKGHAKEILQILEKDYPNEKIYFFDNIEQEYSLFYDRYLILRNESQVRTLFEQDNRFVLAVGDPFLRHRLSELFISWGGQLTTLCSSTANIGTNKVILCEGLNIMYNVVIYSDTYIGSGTLLNTSCTIHHDVIIGEFCEISPGARILGRALVGSFCRIGANSVILPDVTIGDRVVIGAGAVVNKNIPSDSVAVGVPARIIRSFNAEDKMVV